MFTNLGLFSRHDCPDSRCNRPKCMFQHRKILVRPRRPIILSTSPPPEPLPPSPKRARVTGSGEQHARASSSQATARQVSSSKASSSQAPASQTSTSRASSSKPSSGQTSTPSARAASSSAGPSMLPPPPRPKPTVVKLHSGPPMVPVSRTSPQPYPIRQKSLHTLYEQFVKLYAAILPDNPTLAHESALAQEQDVSSSTNNLRAYKLGVHQAAVSISRREPPDRVPHPSIGTVRQSRTAQEAAALEKASRLTRERVEGYCHDRQELLDWGYPDSSSAELVAVPDVGESADEQGSMTTCDRCKVEFVVTTTQERGACKYHPGKPAPEQVDGRRVWIFACCRNPRGSEGCEKGVHVFSHREDDVKLAKKEPFMTTCQVLAQREAAGLPSATKTFDVVGMDCEMIYTTAGSSLARATIVDEDGNTILDEFVRQKHPVLDFNTQFSGVRAEDVEKAVMDVNEVRKAACAFIDENTIMVGHGLENDLRALRLLHDKVVDTAILFPHDKGKPFRRALRVLVKEKLGYFIQDSGADQGHSSAEDAKATLDVLKWKVREDGDYKR